MRFEATPLMDMLVITPQVLGDHRGFFMETWRDSEFRSKAGDFTFVQDNHSRSLRGVLRGLHYQIKKPQGKLVRCIAGEIYDVAVDIRRSSPTFGKSFGALLSSENKTMLWVPPGFAHGFLVISESAEFVYKCTDYYAPADERVINWNDPDIGIDWPQIGVMPVLSKKDEGGVPFRVAEVYE